MMEFHPPTLEEAGSDPDNFYNIMKNKLGYKFSKHCLLDNIAMNTYYELDNYTRKFLL